MRQIHHNPVIITFLDYYPFVHETESFARNLQQIKYYKDLSIKQCAALLSNLEDAAKHWERGKPIANDTYRERIHSFGMGYHHI